MCLLSSFLWCSEELGLPLDHDNNAIDKESHHLKYDQHRIYDSRIHASAKAYSDKKIAVKNSNVSPKKSIQSSVVLAGPEMSNRSFSSTDSQGHVQKKDTQKSMNKLDDDFNNHTSQNKSLGEKSSTVITNQERGEISELVSQQLRGKLSEDQITMVQQVTNSYLDVLFKKLLKRAMKKFITHVVLLIFEEVRLAEKDDKALSDHDFLAICHQVYDKELKDQAAEKKEAIERKNLPKK